MAEALSVPGVLDGAGLRAAFAGAAAHLRERAAAIDAINVYPVPDGDTGSNMAATLRAAVERTAGLERPGVGDVLAALAKGALYGARGNSGVILSQALKGFATGAGDPGVLDGATLAGGLREAARAAYAAVGKPAEGTMLTVLRVAAERAAPDAPQLSCTEVLARAVRGAEAAEEATIGQLPALRESGLTDAGGEGVCTILRGLLAAVTGTEPVVHVLPGGPLSGYHDPHEGGFGFCTEFVVEAAGRPIQEAALRVVAEGAGTSSLVIVGDPAAWHVHVHTEDPDGVLAGAKTLGSLVNTKVEDMNAQNLRYQATGSGTGVTGLLAISRGQGFKAIFEGLGARVLDPGATEKPSAGAIAAAADRMGVPNVVVLPNDKDAILAARQAAGLSRCTLTVVETRSLPQGVAAAMAFLPDGDVGAIAGALDLARGTVKTVELTTAAASRTVDGVRVARGAVIALVDERLVAASESLAGALVAGLTVAGVDDGSLVTLFTGNDVGTSTTEALTEAVRSAFPRAEVDQVEGGQSLYPIIASIE